jgi:hypothetical protein
MKDEVFWLRGPCPPWCVGVHSNHDEREDRRHDSGDLCDVLLTSMANQRSDTPLLASVHLGQGYREVDPLVYFSASHHVEISFTLDEAEQVGTAFREAVRHGEGTDLSQAD